VRRALDALAQPRVRWGYWRPRIEHAQCIAPKDVPRFARIGVIASMQPIHAVADRELADEQWPDVVAHSYAWRALEKAGARLAFGSDAPVESADPMAGMAAATVWRRRARWHPELALTTSMALRAYTSGAAFAAGQEGDLGSIRPGMFCDLTVVDDAGVVATVVGGRVRWRRRSALR
jgi:predicted amidohydrolase YtcJ